MTDSQRLSHEATDPAACRPAAPGPAPTPAPLAASNPPLSATETRVYALLIQRLTERQVAERLERSHNTVHVHVRNIYRKLGLRSRQELFRYHRQNLAHQPANPSTRHGIGPGTTL